MVSDWKKYRLSYTEKAEEILNKLTLEEKISLLSGSQTKEEVRGAIQKKIKMHYNEIPYRAGGIKEKGIPSMYFADGTRGVVCGREKSTCFPVVSMRGATFDPELEEQIGEAIAEEVIDAGANLFGGVCVNLPYHPGWGRAQESYGEDSFLLGEMGTALIKGIQKKGVIACVKHFAFNSMENSRFKVSVNCSKRTEREVFLPHFRRCVEAGAGAFMSAYNSYRGEPCGQQNYLLNHVLRDEWGFDGFVFSDFVWGIKDTKASVNNGLDMEMPITHYYGENLLKAVKDGKVSETVIHQSTLRILRTLLAHQDEINRNRGETDYRKHQKLALQCAREGITLLRNKDQILPLDCKDGRKKIVVLGYLADCENIGDRGSSQVYAPYIVTVIQGLTQYGADAEIVYYAGESLTHCRRLAKDADVVLIVAGNDYMDEGECIAKDADDVSTDRAGGDRTETLGLKQKELSIIEKISELRQDAVVVLVGGSAIMVEPWKEKVGAILMLYYPGMEGGTALAETIFGENNPGGKLPFIIPEKESDLPQMDWDTEEIWYDYYHGYTLLNKNGKVPSYPFGFGLSYTEFKLENERAWRDEEKFYGEITVTNIGKREGTEVVQMYVGVSDSAIERPEYTLQAFQKIFLKPEEAQKVILSCEISALDYYNEKMDKFVHEDTDYAIYLGNSSDRNTLKRYIIKNRNCSVVSQSTDG